MLDISIETEAETDARLRRVICQADLKVYAAPYAFREFDLKAFPALADADALAFVRDDDKWSQLVESDGSDAEAFTIFRFHFPRDADNSGFVGWLASYLKKRFGTGVFVTCGQNSSRGGIFDYWGVPLAIGPQVISVVQELCDPASAARH